MIPLAAKRWIVEVRSGEGRVPYRSRAMRTRRISLIRLRRQWPFDLSHPGPHYRCGTRSESRGAISTCQSLRRPNNPEAIGAHSGHGRARGLASARLDFSPMFSRLAELVVVDAFFIVNCPSRRTVDDQPDRKFAVFQRSSFQA